MSDPVRIFSTASVNNFRDSGGWTAADGARVRWRKFLRSGHWAEAGDADLNLLQELAPQTVVDLRRPRERALQPNRIPEICGCRTLFVDDGDPEEDPPHMKFLRAGNLSRESVHDYMCSAYKRIPHEPRYLQLFSDTIHALARGDTVLIHCSAGKDRTGLLAALVLGLIGVDEDQMFEDYLLTNRAVNVAELLPGVARRISEYLGQTLDPDVIFPMMGVEENYLRTGLREMGGVQAYARNTLRIDEATISALREAMLS